MFTQLVSINIYSFVSLGAEVNTLLYIVWEVSQLFCELMGRKNTDTSAIRNYLGNNLIFTLMNLKTNVLFF